ncbi:MAG: ABC transporter ATP-binding protein [Desulfurococcaceae archaeon]
MARVELRNVVKKFGKIIAVDHVNLDIRSGEFFTLLGPSGCGKTTILRLIAGLEIPDEGEILIDNRVVNDLHPRDRDVAMVFQNYALYPHMTVYENIAFPLIVRKKQLKLSKEDIHKRVVEIARFLGIEELLDRYPSQLSGGQQQRVALARALVRKPKVWLLDEPLSNLDAKLRIFMRSELKKIQKQLGITTIYVTHDQVEAMSMADRIAVLNKGRVLQIGVPDELYSKPHNTFVATFIGAPPMNLIPCNIIEDVEKEYLIPEEYGRSLIGVSGRLLTKFVIKCSEEFTIPISQTIYSKIRDSNINEVYLGIRPEHMNVYRDKPLVNIGVIRSRVEIIEPLGSETILNVRIGDEFIKVRQPPGIVFKTGDEIYIEVDLNKALLFDRKTGNLII